MPSAEAAGKESCQRKQLATSSAGCLGQREVVIAAHNACIRELLQEVNVHGKTDRHMRLLTLRRKAGWAHLGIKTGVINEKAEVLERAWAKRSEG